MAQEFGGGGGFLTLDDLLRYGQQAGGQMAGSATAGLLGAPVDIASTIYRGLTAPSQPGYRGYRDTSQGMPPEQPTEAPWGGSEHIWGAMNRTGLLPPQGSTAADISAQVAGGLLSPAGLVRGAGQLGRGMGAIGENLFTGPAMGSRAALRGSVGVRRVPANRKAVTAITGTQEADIATSAINAARAEKKKTIPRADIEQALAVRAALRAEPATTPGAGASDAEWAAWGNEHGVDMTVTPMQSLGIVDPVSGREVMLPGGLEGKFTIPDLFAIKANNFDPNALPKDVHDELMLKFIRTHEAQGGMDEVGKFNALNFSLLSPNAPLTPNEFLAARTRIRTPDELGLLASRKGEAGLAENLTQQTGIRAARHGGMGLLGTADVSNMADLAATVKSKPGMFDIGAGETMRDVAARTMNQVPGLGPKTASLGVPWTDLNRANVSAVDLHMIRGSTPRLLTDPIVGDDFRERMIGLLKMPKRSTVDEIMAHEGADAAAIKIVGGDTKAQVYRTSKGLLAGGARAELAPDKLLFEPQVVQDFNPFYNRVLDFINESRGADPKLALFPEQWRVWDRIRGRVEPHEMMHPDFRNLPKQSWGEMQGALQEHKAAGYAGLKPVMGASDWKKMYYGGATPEMLGLLGAGSAVAATGYGLLDKQRRVSH